MQTATRRVISYTLPWDDAPVDLSFLFEGEKPAGRHGFIQAKAGRLVFEDGTVGRFWGTNFNSAANFPTHAYSEKVARRLAKFGVNLVRFHQMDADYSTPNIFQFTRGQRRDDTQSLDPRSLERLDYLIHCLKQEGIYVYMDLITYRRFKSGDGVAVPDRLKDQARPYTVFDPRMIELQQQFNEQIWTHVNPYTGLAYKDDPAIILTAITNENDVFAKGLTNNMLEPYRSQLEERYRAWAKGRGLAVSEAPVNFTDDDEPLIAFLGEVQRSYFRTMTQHLRQLGVRIPIAGTNWDLGGAPLLAELLATDFTDAHTYWYDWVWKTTEKRFNNTSLLGERDGWFYWLSFCRFLHKPFFVSEWDHPWPNEFRAEGPIQMAAAAAFQGWSGAAIHTYRYDCRENIDQIGAPITSDAIGGVPFRSGVFDTFNDPAKFGLFYHAALMLRRGDVRESDTATEIVIPNVLLPEAVKVDPASITMPNLLPPGKRLAATGVPALSGTVELKKFGMRLPGEPARAPQQVPMDIPLVSPDATEIRSETGELYRNLAKKYATIDTPRTKVAYGLVGAAGAIRLTGVTIQARSDFAVIALSSLTDTDTAHANNLLLTAIGRADNTGAEYNPEHTIQFKVGHGPIEVEVIEATIELTTEIPMLQVRAINPAGMVIGQIPVTYADGKAKFTIGETFASMYYLIQQA